jgi:hypothetical protein
LLFVLLLYVFGANTAWATDEAPSSEVVVGEFEAALDNHDHGRAANSLAEDARGLLPDMIYGRNAITQFLIGRYSADTTIEVSDYATYGPRVTWMTRITSNSHVQLNWDEAVVINGRIAVWTERPLIGELAVMPTFRRAHQVEPYLSTMATPPADRPQVSYVLLSLGVTSGAVAGILYGIWRERYHPPRGRATRQGGHLLRNLQRWHESDTTLSARRDRAYNSVRGHGPQASRNPRRYSDL